MKTIDNIRNTQGLINEAVSNLKLLYFQVDDSKKYDVQCMIDGITAERKALVRLKNSENTTSVSDARTESGVLHDVGESHASEQTDNDSLASGELPLEKITEGENTEWYCSDKSIGSYKCVGQCFDCKSQQFKRSMKRS